MIIYFQFERIAQLGKANPRSMSITDAPEVPRDQFNFAIACNLKWTYLFILNALLNLKRLNQGDCWLLMLPIFKETKINFATPLTWNEHTLSHWTLCSIGNGQSKVNADYRCSRCSKRLKTILRLHSTDMNRLFQVERFYSTWKGESKVNIDYRCFRFSKNRN